MKEDKILHFFITLFTNVMILAHFDWLYHKTCTDLANQMILNVFLGLLIIGGDGDHVVI
jgi:hypothetical protein